MIAHNHRYSTYLDETKAQHDISSNCRLECKKTPDNKLSYETTGYFYNYLIPPNWQMAEKHMQAQQVGFRPNFNENQIQELCPCCQQPVEKKQINLLEEEIKLSFLGPGYPLYFNFIRFSILLIAVIFLTSGEYNVVTNLISSDCQSRKTQIKLQKHLGIDLIPRIKNICENDFIARASIANKRFHVDFARVSDILNFSSVLVILVLLFQFRKSQIYINNQCDIQDCTPSDYTLMFEDLPILENIEEKIIQYFDQFNNGNIRIEITKINLLFFMDELVHLLEQNANLIKNKKKALSNEIYGTDEYFRATMIWDNKIFELKQKIRSVSQEIRNDYRKFTGTAFISFQLEEEKQFVLNQATFQTTEHILDLFFGWLIMVRRKIEFKNQRIKVSIAPEPLDIIWKNLVYNSKKRLIQRIFGVFLTFIVVALFLLTLLWIAKMQTEILDDDTKDDYDEDENNLSEIAHWKAFCCSIVTIIINNVIVEQLSKVVVGLQSYETYSQYYVSLATKLSLTLFFNSALIAYVANSVYTQNVYGDGGLIYVQFYFFVSNSITQTLLILIDLNYVTKKILLWWHKRKGTNCTLTQSEANELIENPAHEMELRYADIMKTLFMTFFYAPVVPFGYIVSFIGMCCFYYAEKYILLRRQTVNRTPSIQISINMTEILEYLPIIYAVSQLIFKYQIFGYFSWAAVVSGSLAILNAILPMQNFAEMLFHPQEQDETLRYDEAKLQFITDYEKENPITKYEVLNKIIQEESESSSQSKLSYSVIQQSNISGRIIKEEIPFQNLSSKQENNSSNQKKSIQISQ